MNPSGQDVLNIRVRLVQVGQTDQAAKFHLILVPKIVYVAILRARVAIVIIRRVGQRCKLRGGRPIPHMVANDVHHNPHTTLVTLLHQKLKV